MADVPQTSALIVLAQNYAGDLVKQINRRSVLLQVLKSMPGEGKNVAWVAKKSGAIAESYAEGADVANYGSDGQASATLGWIEYRSNFSVTGLAQAVARTSRTPQGNIGLWASNMLDSAEALAKKINQDLYVGAGGNDVTGLGEAIGKVDNTYATIDRTVGANSFWLPTVVDPGLLTPPTFDLIRQDMAAIYIKSGKRPKAAFVSPAVYRTIAGMFDPQKLYLMESAAQAKIQLEGGSQMLKFDGCYFIEDMDATESQIFYVNTDHLRLEYLPIGDQGMGTGMDESADMAMSDGEFSMPLGLRVESLAKTGDKNKATMKCYFQLVCDRPNAHGVRKNVAI